jgi:hypothetical protein
MVQHNFSANEDPYDANLRTALQRARHVGVANPQLSESIANPFGIHYQPGEAVYTIDKTKGLFSRTNGGPAIPIHTYLSLAETTIDLWMNISAQRQSILSGDALQMGYGAAFYWADGFPMFKAVQLSQWYEKIN